MGIMSTIWGWFGYKEEEKPAVININTSGIQKYLVGVAVDKYLLPGSNLNGCVNDYVSYKKSLVDNFGFKLENCIDIINEKAVKQYIIDKYIEVLKKAKAGDWVVFYRSSHGTVVPDRNGDEKDGLDECFVNYDFSFESSKTWFLDDDMAKVLEHLKEGVNLVIIVDSCNSGDITRAFGRINRFIQNPHLSRVKNKKKNLILKRTIKNTKAPYLAISACEANQTSEEVRIGGKSRGIFTYIWEKHQNSNKNATFLQVFNLTVNELKNQQFEQNPTFDDASGLYKIKKLYQ